MLPLPPVSPSPPLSMPPPPNKTRQVSLDQIVKSKQTKPETPKFVTKKQSKPSSSSSLLQPRPRRTNPIIWCAAVICLIFSLVLIFFGVATLIIFLSIKPRNPIIDIPNASLNTIYFDSTEYFNGDFTLVANFSNPNRKIDIKFEYLDVELFYSDRLISSQAVQGFSQRRGETRLESVHFISSLVYLPRDVSVQLQKQLMSNRVGFNLRGTFKVRANLGLVHISYWLHSRCQLQMTGPPTGVLVARNCTTKR